MVKPTIPYQWGGMNAFRGPVMQKGYGLGGFFKGMARTFAPVLKKGLLTVGRKALETGVQVMNDVADGRNFKNSVKQRSKEGLKNVFINKPSTRKPVSRKRIAKKSTSKAKRARRSVDIFDN